MTIPGVIAKPAAAVPPNLSDYDAVRDAFSWDAVARELHGGARDSHLNIAALAVDRHAAGPRRDHVALRCRPAAPLRPNRHQRPLHQKVFLAR